MKFVCDRCQTKYSIADEKVRGKVLKVRCKTCANIITVREAGARRPGCPRCAGARPFARRRQAPGIPMETPGVDSERTQLAQSPFARAAALPGPARAGRATAPCDADRPLAAAAPTTASPWYMALDGNRTGPFSRKQAVDRLAPLPKDADVHVWNEKLDSWKPPPTSPRLAGDGDRRAAAPRRAAASAAVPGRAASDAAADAAAGAARRGPPHASRRARRRGPHAPPSPAGAAVASPAGVEAAAAGRRHPALAPARRRSRGAAWIPRRCSRRRRRSRTHHGSAPWRPHAKTNGVGTARRTRPPAPTNSDVMKMLNLPGGPQAPGAPPRLMSVGGGGGLGAASAEPKGRGRRTTLILGLLVVIGLVIVRRLSSSCRRSRRSRRRAAVKRRSPIRWPASSTTRRRPAPPPPPTPEAAAGARAAAEPHGTGQGAARQARRARRRRSRPRRRRRARRRRRRRAADDRPTPASATTGQDLNITGGGARSRPPPVAGRHHEGHRQQPRRASRSATSARSLRDNSLTHGKISVKLSIGISGRVKHMAWTGRRSSAAARALHQGGRAALGVPAGRRRVRHRVPSTCSRATSSARRVEARSPVQHPYADVPEQGREAVALRRRRVPARCARIRRASRRGSAWRSPTSTTSGCRTSGRRSSTASSTTRRRHRLRARVRALARLRGGAARARAPAGDAGVGDAAGATSTSSASRCSTS